jgi:hypothetical protein
VKRDGKSLGWLNELARDILRGGKSKFWALQVLEGGEHGGLR